MADTPQPNPKPLDAPAPTPARERKEWVWRPDLQGYFRVGTHRCAHPVGGLPGRGGPYFATQEHGQTRLPGLYDSLDTALAAFDHPPEHLEKLTAQRGDDPITKTDLGVPPASAHGVALGEADANRHGAERDT